MYLLKAVRPIVAGVTYVTNASTKPSISHNGTPKSHFPRISTADDKKISNVAHNRSLTAKAMMYILMVDLSFWFLYTAKQTRAFPKKLMMFKRRQTLASIITMIKPRFDNSSEDISVSSVWNRSISSYFRRWRFSHIRIKFTSWLFLNWFTMQILFSLLPYVRIWMEYFCLTYIIHLQLYLPFSTGNKWHQQNNSQEYELLI